MAKGLSAESIADGFKIRFLGCRDRLRNGLFKPAQKLGVPEVRGIPVAIIHRYRRKVIFHHTIDECIIVFRFHQNLIDAEDEVCTVLGGNAVKIIVGAGCPSSISSTEKRLAFSNSLFQPHSNT